MLRSKKGARIEIASFSEWLTNSKEIASFSEWLANRRTLRTKKGARIEIAALKERRVNRDRELFRMARETEGLGGEYS